LRVRIIDVVDDAGWDAPSNAERGYVPRYKRPCADNGALPNGYSWQDRGSNSNPTVITNRHWHGVHDAIAARLDLLIVAFGDDGDIWAMSTRSPIVTGPLSWMRRLSASVSQSCFDLFLGEWITDLTFA